MGLKYLATGLSSGKQFALSGVLSGHQGKESMSISRQARSKKEVRLYMTYIFL